MPRLAAVALACLALPAVAHGQDARALLTESIAAYRAAPALTDSITVTIQPPLGEPMVHRMSVAFGPESSSSFEIKPYRLVRSGDSVYVERLDLPGKVLRTNLDRDLPATMTTLFGSRPSLPFHFAMRRGAVVEQVVDALAMGFLPNPTLGDVTTVEKDGRSIHEVRLASSRGEGMVRIDGATKMILGTTLEATLPNAPADKPTTMTVAFRPTVDPKPAGPITVDVEGRRVIQSLAQFTPAVGDVAPDFTLTTLEGETVPLSSLRGSVVVLDFWATWCGPCRRGLPLLQRFADWAETTDGAVRVYAVDTFERSPSRESIEEQVGAFWKSKNFTMPTLMDYDGAVAGTYGIQSIPYTVVVAPDGTIGAIHRGFRPSMEDDLRADAQRLRR